MQVLKKNATVGDTVNEIRRMAIAGTSHWKIQGIAAQCRNSADPLQTLFDLAYNEILYLPDPDGIQAVRTYDNIVRGRRGNCVTYTQLISSVLFELGIPHWYNVVSYDLPNMYEHIYISANRKILDPVLGQAQDGSDTWSSRPPLGKYNVETKYKYKIKYYMPDLVILQGERSINARLGMASRTRRSRMRLAYGMPRDQEYYESQLGKTIVGKILTGAEDILHGLANAAVNPIEDIFHVQIVGDNYSDTGLGNFISKSQNVDSSMNQLIGTALSTVFTGGSIKVQDIDKQTLAQRAQAAALVDATKQAADQGAQAEIIQQQQQQAQAAAKTKQDNIKKYTLYGLAAATLIGTGVILYNYSQD